MYHLFTDTIKVYPEPTYNQYGQLDTSNPAYTEEIARFRLQTKFMPGKTGFVVKSEANVWVTRDTAITQGCRVSFESIDYQVMFILKARGSGGVEFYKVDLKRIEIT